MAAAQAAAQAPSEEDTAATALECGLTRENTGLLVMPLCHANSLYFGLTFAMLEATNGPARALSGCASRCSRPPGQLR